MKRKPRRPRKISHLVQIDKDQDGEFIWISWDCGCDEDGLKNAKRLYKWLGKAIKYFEAKK